MNGGVQQTGNPFGGNNLLEIGHNREIFGTLQHTHRTGPWCCVAVAVCMLYARGFSLPAQAAVVVGMVSYHGNHGT